MPWLYYIGDILPTSKADATDDAAAIATCIARMLSSAYGSRIESIRHLGFCVVVILVRYIYGCPALLPLVYRRVGQSVEVVGALAAARRLNDALIRDEVSEPLRLDYTRHQKGK